MSKFKIPEQPINKPFTYKGRWYKYRLARNCDCSLSCPFYKTKTCRFVNCEFITRMDENVVVLVTCSPNGLENKRKI